ncbi:MAG: polymorphic toxin type 15 domain-containing protein [Reichenbachiella sp.]|uniref:polymorphic toxin type 15 domain-containing protein n=1 Tax=Reichenbachiella sp. TaxID=2184521 RepID=UPI003264023F
METATKTDTKTSNSKAAAHTIQPKAQELDKNGAEAVETMEAAGARDMFAANQLGGDANQEPDGVLGKVSSLLAPAPTRRKSEMVRGSQVRPNPKASNVAPWTKKQASTPVESNGANQTASLKPPIQNTVDDTQEKTDKDQKDTGTDISPKEASKALTEVVGKSAKGEATKGISEKGSAKEATPSAENSEKEENEQERKDEAVAPGGEKEAGEGKEAQGKSKPPAEGSAKEGGAGGKAEGGGKGARQIEINKPELDGLADQLQGKMVASKGKAGAELKTGSAAKLKLRTAGIQKLATNEKKKKSTATKVAETQAAVQETPDDKKQEMNSAQVESMGKKNKPAVKESEAKKDSAKAVQNLIRNVTTLEDLDNIKSTMPNMTAGIMGTITEQTSGISETYKQLDTTGQKPQQIVKAQALPPVEKAVQTPRLNLGKELVPKVKDEQLAFIEETDKETDNLFAKEGLDMPGVKEVADKITTGDIGKANANKKELKQKTKTGKNEIRKAEADAHVKLDQDLQREENTAKHSMRAERNKNLNAVAKNQGGTKSKIELKRKAVTDRINGIYETANKTVTDKIKKLETGAMSDFDNAQAKATKELEDNITSRMDAFKSRRYSGWIGKGRWIKDLFSDITELSEPKRIFKEEREKYVVKIDGAIATITKASKIVIEDCRKIISGARTQIKNYVKTLGSDVRSAGLKAQNEIKGKLDALDKKVNEQQKALEAKLSEKREAAIQAIDEKIEDMKAAMGPLLSRLGKFLLDALMKVFEWALTAAGKSPKEIMGILKKTRKTITTIVTDPIGFFKNVGAAVGGGFENFKNNFGLHLRNALVGWLTGAVGGALKIPEKFNLAGVFTMVTSALNIGWDFIRGLLVKHIGEPVVRAAESGYELITKVVNEGPMALWEEIKERLSDLKDTVIGAIKEWAVAQIVKKASIKLLTMLNPAGAFVQAVLLIYDTVMFFVNNWDRIVEFVKSVFNSIGDIADGKIGSAAKYIEKMLGLGMTLLMTFLARFVGLGGIATKIKKVITKLGNKVRNAIKKAVKKIADKVKGWFGKSKGGKKKVSDKEVEKDKKEGKLKPETFDMAGDQHTLYFEGDRLIMASKKQSLSTKINKCKKEIKANSEDPRWKGKTKVVFSGLDRIKRVSNSLKSEKKNAKGDKAKQQKVQAKLGKLALIISKFGRSWGLKKLIDVASVEVDKETQQVTISFAYGRSYHKMTDPDKKIAYEKEYKRQLDNQQQGIRKLTVDKWQANRAKYLKKAVETGGSGRSDESAEEQRAAKKELYTSEVTRVMNEHKIGRDKAREIVDKYVALHDPDQVAGGDDGGIVSLGVGSVNYSIGGQWKNKIYQVDAVVEKAHKSLSKEDRSKVKMNVKLVVS